METAEEIRVKVKAGATIKQLALEYGIHASQVWRIKEGKSYVKDDATREWPTDNEPSQLTPEIRRDIFFHAIYCRRSLRTVAKYHLVPQYEVARAIDTCLAELVDGEYLPEQTHRLGELRQQATYLQAALEKIHNVYPEQKSCQTKSTRR